MKFFRWILPAAFFLGCAAPRHSAPVYPTVWNFDAPGGPLTASTGTAVMSYFDPSGSGWGPSMVRFGGSGEFGLPPIGGKETRSMSFPKLSPGQGFAIAHGALPNGSQGKLGLVSNYTLVMDVLWPEVSEPYFRAILQTDPRNEGDADFFFRGGSPGGVGIGGRYHGPVGAGEWHRVALAVQTALGTGGVGQIQKFVDGRFLSGQNTTGSAGLNRWSLRERFLLFSDDDGSAGPGFVSSILFVPRLMSMDEIKILGGPNALGAGVPGEPPPSTVPLTARRVAVIAHRGESCCAPENTAAAIRQAFAHGADHIEVDVQLSADGKAFLMHDEDLDRTSDGKGNASDKNLAGLNRLDAGSWFDRRFAGEPVPSLTQALKAAKGRGRLFLDVKDTHMGNAIRRALEDAGVGPGAIWVAQNVNKISAEEFRRDIPGVEIVWGGVPESLDKENFDGLKALGVAGLELEFESVTSELVAAAHENGLFVFVYTILDPADMLKAIEMGVDGIETDYPAVLDRIMAVGGTPERLPAR